MQAPSYQLRDRWLNAALPRIGQTGWTSLTLSRAADAAGLSQAEQALAAPQGVNDLIEHYFLRAATDMASALTDEALANQRTHEKVATALVCWLKHMETDREAVAMAAHRGLLPWVAGRAAQCTWSIADTIWTKAGDTATDYNRQTKRALLSAVIPPILLYWITAPEDQALNDYVERRLHQAMRVGQSGGRVIGPLLDALSRFRTR